MKKIIFPIDTIYVVAFTKFAGYAKTMMPELTIKEEVHGSDLIIEFGGLPEDKLKKIVKGATEYMSQF